MFFLYHHSGHGRPHATPPFRALPRGVVVEEVSGTAAQLPADAAKGYRVRLRPVVFPIVDRSQRDAHLDGEVDLPHIVPQAQGDEAAAE